MNEKLGKAIINKGEPKKARNEFTLKDLVESVPRRIAITTDDVLEWPNGDLETKKIASILLDAHEQSLGNSALVQYCKSQRVKNWDPDHPEWETVIRTATIRELKQMYRDAERCDFDPEQQRYSHVNNQFAVFIYFNPRTGFCDLVTVGQD